MKTETEICVYAPREKFMKRKENSTLINVAIKNSL